MSTNGYGYSVRTVERAQAADPSSLGVQLGRVCIARKIPVREIAERLSVSRVTVYHWFCGDNRPKEQYVPHIEAYLAELTA
jgi:transcriptional regulator with XRE-family HTH domain